LEGFDVKNSANKLSFFLGRWGRLKKNDIGEKGRKRQIWWFQQNGFVMKGNTSFLNIRHMLSL
jgi:hypothetical protein